jgi:uncharacterized protein YciI
VPLFVLAHSPGPGWDHELPYTEQPNVMEHISFMRSLDRRGLLLLGGPYGEIVPGLPVGMAIVEADDLAAAEALAAEDPSLGLELVTVSVRAWGPRMGSALAP